jgi:hypothetical protein
VSRRYSEKTLRRLAKSSDYHDLKLVVSAPNCPADLLLYFIKEPVKFFFGKALTYTVYANPNLPISILSQYIDSEIAQEGKEDGSSIDYEVREAASQNPSLSTEMIKRWMDYENIPIRLYAHPNFPLDLEYLKKYVFSQIKQKDYWTDHILEYLAKNPNLTLEIVEILVSYDLYRVRVGLIGNKALSSEILYPLISCKDPSILKNLIKKEKDETRREALLYKLFKSSRESANLVFVAKRTKSLELLTTLCLGTNRAGRNQAAKSPLVPNILKAQVGLVELGRRR